MREGRYDKKKMRNYYLVSALLFLLGGLRLRKTGAEDDLTKQLVPFSENEMLISISALLLFAILFLIMGLVHTAWFYKQVKKKSNR